ncbi:MAG TPA: histidine kinase [Bacteroidales bacterium]|nr:histidine kinase [Bacteroidales bacterium]
MIPIIGAAISLLYFINPQNVQDHKRIVFVLHSVIITSGIWLGCNTIVIFLWKQFPWEFYPIKHVIIEFILILVYTNLFSYGMYILLLHIGFIADKAVIIDLYTDVLVTNLITFLITAIHEAVFFYRQWKYNFSKSIQLEKEHIQAKYDLLKSQIQPHFLFNSLNALYSLVFSNNQARNYVQNLSEFIRYSISHNDTKLVLFQNELEITKKYLEIQQTRYGDNLQVEITVDPNTLQFLLPPMALLTIVENCIKHNIISSEKPLTIYISTLPNVIRISNNLQKRNDVYCSGQGLQNVIQRYSFVCPQKVVVTEIQDFFIVEIPLINNIHDTNSNN